MPVREVHVDTIRTRLAALCIEAAHLLPEDVREGLRRAEASEPAPLAKQTGLQGTVVLRALIGTDGAVREVQLVSGPYLLGQAAMDAVLQWRYQPTLLNGQPMEVETRITVIFTLNR